MAKCQSCGSEFSASLFNRLSGKAHLCPNCIEVAERNQRVQAFKLGQIQGKYQEIAADGFVDATEEKAFENLMAQFDLAPDDIAPTWSGYQRLLALSALQEGRLPVLSDVDIILNKNEVCHLACPARLMEEKTRTRYVGGSQGLSFPIGKHGVRYRVGAFAGQPVQSLYKQVTDTGALYVTSKRVLFRGARKNVTYPMNKIVAVTKFSDAIQLSKENEATPKFFLLDEQFAIDAVGLMVNRLAGQ